MISLANHKPWLRLGLLLLLWSLACGLFLVPLIAYARKSDLQSYILLVPFVSAYLLYLRREQLRAPPSATTADRRSATLFGDMALALLGLQVITGCGQGDVPFTLLLPTLAYVTGVNAVVVLVFGLAVWRATLFSWLFLYAMLPLPEPVQHLLRVMLQQGSVWAADGMFLLSGTAFLREGNTFRLPGMNIELAEVCSGIHSTLVLFLASFVAGALFLRRTWSRIALVLVVIPLALLRNGFRVFALVMLTMHVDPGVITGPLHHKGGPIFFALSLVVFLGILEVLRWLERRRKRDSSA